MAYSFDNRIKFIVRYMYDIDNNGILDKNDFDCMAVRATIIETRGNFEQKLFEANQKVMKDLWLEFTQIADFDKDDKVTTDEFKKAVEKSIVGKKYKDFPKAFKLFITIAFKTIDINGDGIIGLDEYRMDAVTRFAFNDIRPIDDAYNKLVTEADKKIGGLNLARYEELFAEFLTTSDVNANGVYLFGPLSIL